MSRRIIVTSVLAAVAALAATGHSYAQQYGVDYRQVGQWDVETVVENGIFFGCRANTKTSTGIVGLLQYAKGNWVVTVPDMNFAPGTKLSGMLSVNRASIPVAMTASVGRRREAVKIDNSILDALRQGGRMVLEIGGKTFNWQMNDASAAMGTVQDCRTAAMKYGIPAKPGGAPKPMAAPAGNPSGSITLKANCSKLYQTYATKAGPKVFVVSGDNNWCGWYSRSTLQQAMSDGLRLCNADGRKACRIMESAPR